MPRSRDSICDDVTSWIKYHVMEVLCRACNDYFWLDTQQSVPVSMTVAHAGIFSSYEIYPSIDRLLIGVHIYLTIREFKNPIYGKRAWNVSKRGRNLRFQPLKNTTLIPTLRYMGVLLWEAAKHERSQKKSHEVYTANQSAYRSRVILLKQVYVMFWVLFCAG